MKIKKDIKKGGEDISPSFQFNKIMKDCSV